MKKLIYIGLSFLLVQQAVAQAVVTASGNVRLNSSTGTRLVLQGGIAFTGTSNFIDNGRVDLLTNPSGAATNWTDATATGAYDATSTGHVFFSASALQTITGPTQFYNLTMNGTTGISLSSNTEVRNQLHLNGGMFNTGLNKVYISNTALNAIQSTNSFSSFINGILERAANIVTSPTPYSNGYLFPIGKVVGSNNYYAPVYFNKTNTTGTRYTAEYFFALPFDRNNIQNPPILYVSRNEYWEITSTTAGGSPDDDAFVSLSWRDVSNVSTSAASRDELMVAHYRNNVGFRWEPEFNQLLANNVTGTSTFGFVTTNLTVGSFTSPDRRFTLSTRTPNNVLPYKYFDWNLTAFGNSALINWDVEDDVTITRYQVERSSNGFHFVSLNTTPSKKQVLKSNYSFIDDQPLSGWNYYRIKIVENEGSHTYSTVKKVQFGKSPFIRFYPNPATSVVQLQLNEIPAEGAMIQIVDVSGKTVYQTPVLQSNMQLNVTSLLPGTYVLRYINNGNVQSFKFIKINP
jgi:hypothetical protein